ncbi:hypothetical protein DEO72_LG11g1335 [Vigna unguiculata]|uniref:Uncharacterized protein n=1 Tax=Vigna unguiculata TaxID=3917 RepID=A0A4D6NL25_VIGUN|nr:hypothetical protein DEO72_LG11g1335 [Vigna unguiculata]
MGFGMVFGSSALNCDFYFLFDPDQSTHTSSFFSTEIQPRPKQILSPSLAAVEGCTAVEDFAAVEGFVAVEGFAAVEGFVAVEDCCRRR